MAIQSRGQEPFPHQRLVSWETTFPPTRVGVSMGGETGGCAPAVMPASSVPQGGGGLGIPDLEHM